MCQLSFARNIFPLVKMTFSGLKPQSLYTVSLKVMPADCHHYQYHTRRWHVSGPSEAVQEEHKLTAVHPKSPETGHFWMDKPVSFGWVKVTNEDHGEPGMVRHVAVILMGRLLIKDNWLNFVFYIHIS